MYIEQIRCNWNDRNFLKTETDQNRAAHFKNNLVGRMRCIGMTMYI